jgi:hypothetical protein
MYLKHEEFVLRFPEQYKILSRRLKDPSSYYWYVYLPSEGYNNQWWAEDPDNEGILAKLVSTTASVGCYGRVDRNIEVRGDFRDLELRRKGYEQVVEDLSSKLVKTRKTKTKWMFNFKTFLSGVLTSEQEQAYTEALFAIFGTTVTFEGS